MRGQLSAEMLIVLVVILGLVVILASVMLKGAQQAGEAAEGKINITVEQMKGDKGAYSIVDSDCKSDSCDTSENKCY